MSKEKLESGVETTFHDKDGKPIRVHSYIKDGEGMVYYINSHCQAVPEDEAPAVELAKLVESTEVTCLTAEEVLSVQKPEPRRRGRKSRKQDGNIAAAPAPEPQAEQPVQGKPEGRAEAQQEALIPFDLKVVLSAIPDKILADELRRRGYSLCAVKPAFIQL